MRIVVLDTETTGLNPSDGHRVIEIGCVELVDRQITTRRFQQYINPDREVDPGALAIHNISNEFLEDKPKFSEITDEFMEFITGAELVAHNAKFDVGFLNHELKRVGGKYTKIEDYCTITDTLPMARELHPGQRNSLDALMKRYKVDHIKRELHGALLDAEILAHVYLAMTSGQSGMFEASSEGFADDGKNSENFSQVEYQKTPIIYANEDELAQHNALLEEIAKESDDGSLW